MFECTSCGQLFYGAAGKARRYSGPPLPDTKAVYSPLMPGMIRGISTQ